MDKILLIAKKEAKQKIFLSLVIGVLFGVASGKVAVAFWQTSPLFSLGITLLILNLAVFLLGANIVAKEKSKGTFSFILTLPLRNIEIVLGKLLGLIILIAPTMLINIFVFASASVKGGYPVIDFNYLLPLLLYILFSASLILFVSSQFQRLPLIFLMFLFYQVILSIPGTYWFQKEVVTAELSSNFLTSLIIFSFFTPLFLGVIEHLFLQVTIPVSNFTQTGGSETAIVILKKLPGDFAFSMVNLFSPLWHSSLLALKNSEFFKTYAFFEFIAIFSILLTVTGICLLTSFQLRRSIKKGFSLFLVVALLPLIFGFFISL